MELLKVYDFLRNPEVMAFAGLTLCQVTWWLLVHQGHERAHKKEAEKYHKLKNPVITDSHFDCDNWGDFSEPEIRKVALAGIKFDLKICIPMFIFIRMQPLTTIFPIILMFGNSFPHNSHKFKTTDGYWFLHPDEFLKSKQKIKYQNDKL